MTNKEIQEISEKTFSKQIYQVLNDSEKDAGEIYCHSVCVLWVSPIIKHFIERKIAYFPEYGDAKEYLDFVSKSYSELNLSCAVYLNGAMKACSKDWEEIVYNE